ncbi:response regulator transcription factor [Cellulophaga baltica]|uniref:DNA-binding response regulator, OmpR family, contains REC and winged-helix (WHTH) domain n=1 Tax=Cellulophaga baltica TaxID=76594 RepID=A0A1G7KMX5_9FLAO|nr:response regulator transcription factor [Cellulophaga baltica]SDF38119.1 DNA-binding response regulator, OmpR family, contains REC and winged-helix (wHTH) domain [Cellulophaga baltica]
MMQPDKYAILLVEDDESLGYLLSEYLKMKNFLVTWVKSGLEAVAIIETDVFQLAILDVMMPEMDGYTLASKMKSQFPELPFLFLTARSLKIDVLKGFSLGAVDYLKKPIDEEELVVRINVLLDRLVPKENLSQESNTLLSIGGYKFDVTNQQLKYQDAVIKLTSREAELLQLLVENKNQLCSHKDILVRLWGKNDYFNRKSLNVFVSHLRKYLSYDSAIKLENIHRKGFILLVK